MYLRVGYYVFNRTARIGRLLRRGDGELNGAAGNIV